mmetsp:Transcript_56031/g.158909  ORF Transcript_56031/g.158909 Transcript_56031/m.158909 type:complete len:364 (+) Transcript_56031:955-2046(+)
MYMFHATTKAVALEMMAGGGIQKRGPTLSTAAPNLSVGVAKAKTSFSKRKLFDFEELYSFRASSDHDYTDIIETAGGQGTLYGLDPDLVSMPLLELIGREVQKVLFDKVFEPLNGAEEGVSRYGNIHVDIGSKTTTVLAKPFANNLKLYFAGPVSTEPSKSKNSFNLCTVAFGDDLAVGLWLNGDPYKTLANRCPIPAWYVETAKDDSDANMTLVMERLEVTLSENILNLVPPEFRQDFERKLTIALPVLVARPNAPTCGDDDDDEPIVLFRLLDPKPSAKGKENGSGNAKVGGRRARGSIAAAKPDTTSAEKALQKLPTDIAKLLGPSAAKVSVANENSYSGAHQPKKSRTENNSLSGHLLK